ncbi:MAG: type II toxin-antitoxin system PemK/MazF family toxin [Sphingomonadales bacterium]
MVKRGEVWLVTLDPTNGSEIQKTRPCLIISPDELNGIIHRAIIAPMTSGSHPAPYRVAATFRRKEGLILLDQIRTVDRMRLVKRLGQIEQSELSAVLNVLREMFTE